MRQQVNLIQEVMKEVMQKDQHYGVVPGCGNKPALFKSGAEKLAMTFRLRPIIKEHGEDVKITMLENGHRDYLVFCHVYNMTGVELATGVGSASTMESKYRYRRGVDFKVIGDKIPKDYKEQKEKYRREGFGAKSIDGSWKWVEYTKADRSENPDIADTYNTILKMAKKRAFVDGVLSATGASDIFTQDIEDLPHDAIPSSATATAEEDKNPAPPRRKSETAPKTEDAPTPTVHTLAGKVASYSEPKGKSKYWSFTLDTGPGVYLQTADEYFIETMMAYGKSKAPIEVTYEESTNGAYTNRRIVSVNDAPQPEEK
jgi:hypothetical protein